MNRAQKAGYWMLDAAYSAADELVAAADRRPADEYFEAVQVVAAPVDARPVVLVPGVFETWGSLRAIGVEARRLGHPVSVVSELGRNTAPVEQAARVLARHLVSKDLRDVILLAHSKGGLIGKYLMLRFDLDRRVDGLIAVNTPFSGSQWGRVVPMPSVRAFDSNDRILRFLSETSDVDSRIVSVYSTFDQNVWAGSRLDGARNVRLNVAGHSRILASRALRRLLPEAISWLPARQELSRIATEPREPSPR